jgi:hypothetical protein
MENKVDLFDMLDFCAEYNFDAIDPTGYYFPGFPEVPSDEFMMNFKRQAFLQGLVSAELVCETILPIRMKKAGKLIW